MSIPRGTDLAPRGEGRDASARVHVGPFGGGLGGLTRIGAGQRSPNGAAERATEEGTDPNNIPTLGTVRNSRVRAVAATKDITAPKPETAWADCHDARVGVCGRPHCSVLGPISSNK